MTTNDALVLISLVTGKEVQLHPCGSFRVGFHSRIPDDQLTLLEKKGVSLIESEQEKDGGSYRFKRYDYSLAAKAN